MTQVNLSFDDLSENNEFQWSPSALWRHNKPLVFTTVFSVLLLVLTALGMLFDTRTVLGEPVWVKPTKFAISSAFYAGTLVWILSYIKNRPNQVRAISWILMVTLIGELVLIAIQAYRGVRSHYNVATPFDLAVFSTMGTMITVLWIASLWAVVLLARQPFKNQAWGLAIKLGLFVSFIGAGLGYLMTSPTAAQLAAVEAGEVMMESGAHSVGVPDGGAGLPFVGWSTEGGDLRIGHFIGLHGMQVIPLIGWFIVQQNNRLSAKRQRYLIWIAGLAYLGTMGLVTWQALRAEPLIYPGALTLSSWAVLITAVVASSAWVLRAGKSDQSMT